MSLNLKAKARQTTAVERVSEGADAYLRSLRDGTLSTAGFIQAMSFEGRVFGVNAGTVTSPITFNPAAIVTTGPDLMVLAPAGTTIIPIEVCIQMEAFGTTAIFEAMVSIGTGGVLGTDTDVVPVCLNSVMARATQCSAGAAANEATATYFTGSAHELMRWGAAKAVTVGTAIDTSAWPPLNLVWRAMEGGYLPIVKGSGGFAVFAAAQASTGFISAKWIELPTSVVE